MGGEFGSGTSTTGLSHYSTVSNTGLICKHCKTIATFGLAHTTNPHLVEGQEPDSRGIVHDPVFHQEWCPTQWDWFKEI